MNEVVNVEREFTASGQPHRAAHVGSPDRTIARSVFGRTWKASLALGVTFGGVAAASAASYVSSFPTEASRRTMAATFSGDGGFSMLFGSVAHLDRVGGYTAYKTYVLLTTIGAVWAILTTTRLLRGEEESGRWSLLLAGRTNPGRVTAATLTGIFAGTMLIALVTLSIVALSGTSDTIGFGIGGSALFAGAAVLPAVVFVGIAAIASQLASTRRLASTIAMGCFAASFVLRMLGDAGARSHWVLWVTPLGWSELVQPFIGNHPLPLLAGVALAVVSCTVAVSLANRRDTGSGVFATSETRAPNWMGLGTPLALGARLAAPIVIAWAVALIATALIFGAVTHSVVDALDASKSLQSTLTRLGSDGAGPVGYLSVAFILLGSVLALVPAHHIGMARDEESSGRLAYLAAGPVDRRGWLAGRLELGALVVVMLGPISGLACWAGAVTFGAHVAFLPVVEAGLFAVPAALLALAIGALALAVVPRIAAASVEMIVGWSLVIDLLGSMVDRLGPLTRLSLFHYSGSVPASTPDWVAFTVMVVVACTITAVALTIFGRRDLAVG